MKQKPLPEILPGPDGESGYLEKLVLPNMTAYYVSCGFEGFRGPLKDTRYQAILAWNRVMSVYHSKKGEK